MGNKTRKTTKKVNIVFDEAHRREFLTGFHKRKLQRKKQAQEKLEKRLKDERKRLKQEAKESYKKLVQSHKDIPEVENLLTEEYEDDDVTVKVVELSTFGIAQQNNWIGSNQPMHGSDDESNQSEDLEDQDNNKVPGMELKHPQPVKNTNSEKQLFGSEKEVKKALKKEATKKVKKSKVFQMKNKIESQKQRKKSLQQKKLKAKLHHTKNKRRSVNHNR